MSFTDAAETRYQALQKAQPSEARVRAWKEYLRLGLPDASTESWKYTSFNLIGSKSWSSATPAPESTAAISELIAKYKSEFDIAVIDSGKITFQSGNRVTPIATGSEVQIEDGFAGLSVAVNHGGFQIEIDAGSTQTRPILLVHAHSGVGQWPSTFNSIRVGRLAEVKIAELYLGEGGNYLRSDLTTVSMDEGSNFNWVRLQEEDVQAFHFSEAQVSMAANTTLQLTGLNSGAAWSRTSTKIEILGEGANATVNGLSFGRNQQHIDQRVRVRHRKGNSESHQLFKSVLNDRSRGVLNGKIHIDQDAQKVNSSQLNHNLLLSSLAEADTKPELEIYADDVKANHGASIGRLDEDKLFYLLSRAIPRAEAIHILAGAFVGEVVMKVADSNLRKLVEDRVEKVLPLFSERMEAL